MRADGAVGRFEGGGDFGIRDGLELGGCGRVAVGVVNDQFLDLADRSETSQQAAWFLLSTHTRTGPEKKAADGGKDDAHREEDG